MKMKPHLNRYRLYGMLCLCIYLGLPIDATASNYEILGIEPAFNIPLGAAEVHSFAIILSSARLSLQKLPKKTQNTIGDHLTYQSKVKVNGALYYRLVVGNFASGREARNILNKLKPTFSGAWVYQRSDSEIRQLMKLLSNRRSLDRPSKLKSKTTDKDKTLLASARQAFLDQNYSQVISISKNIVSVGTIEQVRAALELAGSAYERQRKFKLAVRSYENFLGTGPPKEAAKRILSRLEGIRTMRIKPKARLKDEGGKSKESNWFFRGALQQYYRDDLIEPSDEDSEVIVEEFVTNLDMQIKRRGDNSTLSIEIEAALIADLLAEQSDNRISRAELSYARSSFRITGGRQRGQSLGLYGAFDGLSYSDFSISGFQPSLFLGTRVDSSHNDQLAERRLIGANLDFSLTKRLDLKIYFIHQEADNLIDRQAIGSELQWQSEGSFVFGKIDYDAFYEEINHLTLNSSYRITSGWTINFNLAQANSPTISTLNALVGQAALSLDELSGSFTDDQIYQLARDRTSYATSFYLSSVHSIDSSRLLSFDASFFELEASVASAGVAATSSSSQTLLSMDYSIRNFLALQDYTTMGLRLSQSEASEILSLRFRSRISGSHGVSYDPRLQLDFRQDTRNNIDQMILKPSLNLRFRATKRLSMEANFGVEYSELNLPGFDQQVAYSFYLGYLYYF